MRAAKKIATINLVISVCPFARMKKTEFQVNDFHKVSYLGFYTKICRDVTLLFKSTIKKKLQKTAWFI